MCLSFSLPRAYLEGAAASAQAHVPCMESRVMLPNHRSLRLNYQLDISLDMPISTLSRVPRVHVGTYMLCCNVPSCSEYIHVPTPSILLDLCSTHRPPGPQLNFPYPSGQSSEEADRECSLKQSAFQKMYIGTCTCNKTPNKPR